jgi:thiol-disulfide isomerase/thioredoxin
MFDQLTNTWNEMSFYMKLGVLAIVVIVLYFVYSKFQQRGMPADAVAEGMGMRREGGEVVCTMYYTDSCPHCVKAKPEWAKFEDQYNGKVVNGKKILIVKINCQENPEVAEKENIKGFPTFKFAFNGKTFDYEDDRVLQNFVDFLQRITQSQ